MSRRSRPAPPADTVEVVRTGSTQTAVGPAPWRPLAALGLAVVVWLPSARALLAGDLDINVACVRFLIAVAISWVALTIVAAVVRGYATPADAPAPAPRRRRTDVAGADGRPPSAAAPAAEKIEAVDAIDVTATEAPAEPA